jgi:DNA-binding LacI/PurR family transcriptional regulator
MAPVGAGAERNSRAGGVQLKNDQIRSTQASGGAGHDAAADVYLRGATTRISAGNNQMALGVMRALPEIGRMRQFAGGTGGVP